MGWISAGWVSIKPVIFDIFHEVINNSAEDLNKGCQNSISPTVLSETPGESYPTNFRDANYDRLTDEDKIQISLLSLQPGYT